jgi:hypothetical protein
MRRSVLGDKSWLTDTFVTYMLVGPDLDPDHITQAVGIEPSTAIRRGEPVGRLAVTLKHQDGRWMFTSQGSVTTDDVVDHLAYVLGHLLPHASVLAEYRTRDGWWADVSCFWTSESGHGPWFTVDNLIAITKLNADLSIDFYHKDELEDEERHSEGSDPDAVQ